MHTRSVHSDTIDQMLTPDEVADLIRMSRCWVITNAKKGRIPHRRFGKLYRFAAKDLEEIEAAAARPATSTRGAS